jgi:hypothetical protein
MLLLLIGLIASKSARIFVAGSRAQVAFEAIGEKFQLSFSDYLLPGGSDILVQNIRMYPPRFVPLG